MRNFTLIRTQNRFIDRWQCVIDIEIETGHRIQVTGYGYSAKAAIKNTTYRFHILLKEHYIHELQVRMQVV